MMVSLPLFFCAEFCYGHLEFSLENIFWYKRNLLKLLLWSQFIKAWMHDWFILPLSPFVYFKQSILHTWKMWVIHSYSMDYSPLCSDFVTSLQKMTKWVDCGRFLASWPVSCHVGWLKVDENLEKCIGGIDWSFWFVWMIMTATIYGDLST